MPVANHGYEAPASQAVPTMKAKIVEVDDRGRPAT